MMRRKFFSVAKKAAAKTPSIAVLPFANMSGDKDNEYFSDGLAEEIINTLTKVPRLKVAARTSAFAFKGKERRHPWYQRGIGCRPHPGGQRAQGGQSPARNGAVDRHRRRLPSVVGSLRSE